jgi:Ni,Fe-hydrogenase maturation factor
MNEKYVLVFGNTDIKEDSLAKEIAGELSKEIKDIKFIDCNKPDDVLEYINSDFFILDVVKRLDSVKLFLNIDDFSGTRSVTLHDFDLSTFLKILKETGDLKSVKIIGIPQFGDKEKIKNDVVGILNGR